MGKIKLKKKHIILIVCVVVISGIAVTALLFIRKPKQAASEPTITYSTDSPDESKSNADNYNWRGAPDEPKKIRISKISVDAYVQKSGVDQNKAVAVPNNVHLTGWFSESAKPGQNGLAIISGHVSGKTTDGVFKNLKQLQKGDEFEVELGNGQVKSYKVIDTKQVKEKDAASILFSQNPKVKSQVNLITCGGKFNSETNQYEDRIIVSGELK